MNYTNYSIFLFSFNFGLEVDFNSGFFIIISDFNDSRKDSFVFCIEFDETSRNHLDTGYVERIKDSINSLMAFGYEIIAKEPDCNNFTLMHERLL